MQQVYYLLDIGLISNYIVFMVKQESPKRILSIMSRKLRASYDFILARMKETGLEDLDISHGDILFQLYRHGSMPMKELAERIGRDKSTVTALVSKMERRALLCRVSDPQDGRVSVIGLTKKGESYRDDYLKISDEVMAHLYKGFSKDEKNTLITLLAKLGE